MMKYCLAALAVLALAGVPALAQVDNNYLDGTINAWAQHGMLQTANVAYYGAWPTPPPPVVNIVSYGMTVQGGTVYGMIQLDNPISTVSGTTTVNSNGYLQSGDNNWKGAIWAGWYINADNNTSTSLAGEPIGWGMPGPGPNGTDIEPEWDISDQPYAPYGFNLWGAGGSLGNGFNSNANDSAMGAPYNAAHNPLSATSTVLEFSMSVSALQAAITACGQGVVAGDPSTWQVYMKVESQNDDGSHNAINDDVSYLTLPLSGVVAPICPATPTAAAPSTAPISTSCCRTTTRRA